MAPDVPDDETDPPSATLAESGAFDTRSYRPSVHGLGFLLAVGALAGLFAYDYVTSGPLLPYWTPVVGRTDFAGIDWLYFLALVLFAFWVAFPLAARPALTGTYWRRLRADATGLAAFAGVVVFVVAGLFAPLVVGETVIRPAASYQPPVGFSVDASLPVDCVGDVVDGRCQGTWTYPLGTNVDGTDVLTVTALGAQTALRVAVVTATIIVPLAVAVGLAAGYRGGRLDEFLMGATDVVGTVPPFVAYVVARFVFGSGDLLLLVVTFALVGWAGVARAVRNDVRSRRDALYVRVAESAGGSHLWILRGHLLPNVSGTVAATTAQQVSFMLLAEAALSFVEFGAPQVLSWGTVIRQGGSAAFAASILQTWWISLVPVVALATTVVAVNVFGDALRDVLDPRE